MHAAPSGSILDAYDRYPDTVVSTAHDMPGWVADSWMATRPCYEGTRRPGGAEDCCALKCSAVPSCDAYTYTTRIV